MRKRKAAKTAAQRTRTAIARRIADESFRHFQMACEAFEQEVYWEAAEELSASLEGVFMERDEQRQ
jgi:hypothetical protein